MKEKELPFLDHLKELRKRLIRSLIAVLVVFLPLIFFSNEIYELASSPLQALMPDNSSMIATQVASPFLSPLKLTFYLSLTVSIPYFLTEIWRFIAPGLFKNEKKTRTGVTNIQYCSFLPWDTLRLLFSFPFSFWIFYFGLTRRRKSDDGYL